jgi:tetratricopeptide (TPR) repeat protein
MNKSVAIRLDPAVVTEGTTDDIELSIRQAMRVQPGSAEYADSLLALSLQLMRVDGQLAIRVLRNACESAATHRHAKSLAEALTQLAWLLCSEGQLANAYLRASHAQTIAEQHVFKDTTLKANYVLADIAARKGDLDDARARLESMLASPDVDTGSARQADYLNRLASIAIRRGAAQEAVALSAQSVAIYRTLNDSMLAVGLNLHAMALSAAGRATDAYAAGEEALALTPPEQTNQRATILHTLGAAANAASDVVYAGRRLFEAYEIDATKSLFTNLRCDIRIALSALHATLNQPHDAIGFLNDALGLAHESALWASVSEIHRLLQTAYIRLGDASSADRHAAATLEAQRMIATADARAAATLTEAHAHVTDARPIWVSDPFRPTYAF